MAGKDPYGMAIRLPEDMVVMLKKLRDEERLPSMAMAIKYWVEQEAAEKREMELAEIKKTVENTEKDVGELAKATKAVMHGILERDKVLQRTCNAVQIILGPDNELSRDMRKLCSKEPDKCPIKDEPGLIPKIIERITAKPRGKPKNKTPVESNTSNKEDKERGSSREHVK